MWLSARVGLLGPGVVGIPLMWAQLSGRPRHPWGFVIALVELLRFSTRFIELGAWYRRRRSGRRGQVFLGLH